ncbi:MAG: hypothetical protein LBC49_00375 [Bacteroidales bacterium]|jgi:hypothetical protein|nr:hypothetical protein [Bacteroidales bacterium]
MKKIFTLLLALFVFFSPLASFSPLAAQSLPIQKYYAGLSVLPPNQLLSIAKAQNLYFRTFKNIPPATCDSGYVLFEDFLIVALDSIDFDLPFKAKDEAYLNKLKLAGLLVVDNGRLVTVKPDMNYFLTGFRPYLSANMRKYFERIDNENKEGFISNDSLVISFAKLAERVLFWDDFYFTSTDFVLTDEVLQQRERYLEALIFGEPLSSIWAADDTLRGDVRSALETVQSKASDGLVKRVVDGYLQVLQSCNYSKCGRAIGYTW